MSSSESEDQLPTREIDSGEDSSSEDDEEEAFDKKQMSSVKSRFKYQSIKAGHGDDSAGEDDDDEEEEEEEPKAPMTLREKLTAKGPMGDLYPYNGDPEGRFGFRCKRCPDKVLQSQQDAIQHLTSKYHRRNFLAALKETRTDEENNSLAEKKQARLEKLKEARKAKQKKKTASLTPEQIERRKEKAKAKTERRLARKRLAEAEQAKQAQGQMQAKKVKTKASKKKGGEVVPSKKKPASKPKKAKVAK